MKRSLLARCLGHQPLPGDRYRVTLAGGRKVTVVAADSADALRDAQREGVVAAMKHVG
jgi:hypothetical protein